MKRSKQQNGREEEHNRINNHIDIDIDTDIDTYSSSYQSCLLRIYGARSPSNPRQIKSPPFPNHRWLARRANQTDLFNLLVVEQPSSMRNEGQRWKLAFWKRIINSIELTLSTDPSFQEEEIDERILNYYISLQQSSNPDFHLNNSLDNYSSSTETLTYFYGNLNDRSDWNRITLHENKACISHGTTGLKSWGASVCLANYLILNPQILENVTILELGSGTGLLGILAHQLNPKNVVYLTDCNQMVLDRLKLNTSLNRKESDPENLLVKYLDWDSRESFYDSLHPISTANRPILILGADIIYDPDLIPGLVLTIKKHLQKVDHYQQSKFNHDDLINQSSKFSYALVCAIIREPSTWELFLKTASLHDLKFDFFDIKESIKMGDIDQGGIILTQALDHIQSQIDNLKLIRLKLDL